MLVIKKSPYFSPFRCAKHIIVKLTIQTLKMFINKLKDLNTSFKKHNKNDCDNEQ